ncbi:MAG: hypothetical protein WC700_18540 [Gemmatimonadaceae bacterium]|jgi:hypothetical protein
MNILTKNALIEIKRVLATPTASQRDVEDAARGAYKLSVQTQWGEENRQQFQRWFRQLRARTGAGHWGNV